MIKLMKKFNLPKWLVIYWLFLFIVIGTSSTYAWFEINNQVDVNNIGGQVKEKVEGSDLVINEAGYVDFEKDIIFNYSNTLNEMGTYRIVNETFQTPIERASISVVDYESLLQLDNVIYLIINYNDHPNFSNYPNTDEGRRDFFKNEYNYQDIFREAFDEVFTSISYPPYEEKTVTMLTAVLDGTYGIGTEFDWQLYLEHFNKFGISSEFTLYKRTDIPNAKWEDTKPEPETIDEGDFVEAINKYNQAQLDSLFDNGNNELSNISFGIAVWVKYDYPNNPETFDPIHYPNDKQIVKLTIQVAENLDPYPVD